MQLRGRIAAGDYTPIILRRDGRPIDFTFMPALQYGPETELVRCQSFSALLDDFYAEKEAQERVKQRGQDFIRSVTQARTRTARKIANQEQDLRRAADREQLRRFGDIITTNFYQMRKGQTLLRAQDYYDPACAEVEIPLDPLLTPQQNAAKYYKEYKKAQKAEEMLSIQLEKNRRELDYLDSVLQMIGLSEGDRDLQEIRQELMDNGYLKQQKRKLAAKGKQKVVRAKPMEFRSTAGLPILVGKNNSQNDRLTLREADKRDIWLHVQKLHGSHVILCTGGAEPDGQSLTEAAMLAAWFSQGKDSAQVPVDYTPVRVVKKPAGAKPGFVVYATYRTLYVTPDEALVKKLRPCTWAAGSWRASPWACCWAAASGLVWRITSGTRRAKRPRAMRSWWSAPCASSTSWASRWPPPTRPAKCWASRPCPSAAGKAQAHSRFQTTFLLLRPMGGRGAAMRPALPLFSERHRRKNFSEGERRHCISDMPVIYYSRINSRLPYSAGGEGPAGRTPGSFKPYRSAPTGQRRPPGAQKAGGIRL